MKRKLISSDSIFEKEIGYSRAVIDGDYVFVSGTTGFNYSDMTIADDIQSQTEQCLINIINCLQEANASIENTVRVMYIIPKAEEFKLCWPILKKYFGSALPAATMISAGLADPRMKIEIQVTVSLNK